MLAHIAIPEILDFSAQMECLRWAFRYGRWSPSREEWLLASRLVQQDERDRISRFVYQVDAKAAMVSP